MVAWLIALIGCSPTRLISTPPPSARPVQVSTQWTSPQARELALLAELAMLGGRDPVPYLQRMALYDGSLAAQEQAFLIEARLLLRQEAGVPVDGAGVAALLAKNQKLVASKNADVLEWLFLLQLQISPTEAEPFRVAALEQEQDPLQFKLRFSRLCGMSLQTSCTRLAQKAPPDPVSQAEGELRGEEARTRQLWSRLVLENTERQYPMVAFVAELGWYEAARLRPRTAYQTLRAMQLRNPDDAQLSRAQSWLDAQPLFTPPPSEATLRGQEAALRGDIEQARAELRAALAQAPELAAALALIELGDVGGDARWLLPVWERYPQVPALSAITQQLAGRYAHYMAAP